MQHPMRYFLVWLFLACPLPLGAANYWHETHLSFDHLKSVALAKCYDNPDELIGCYRAIGGALGTAGDVKPIVSEPKDGEILVRSFGIVKLVRSTEDDALSSVYQFWQGLIAQRNQDVQVLEAHFHDSRAPHVDFNAIVDFIKTLTPEEKEAERAAHGINEYFAVVFDPHTQISTRHDLADSINGSDNSYVGVGIGVYKLGARYLVTAVNPDGPAFTQGVRINDFLTYVDGQATAELSLEQLISSVRGKADTTVTLTLSRDGQSLDVVVPRKTIYREAVESKLLTSEEISYGYLRIQDFMNDKACEKTAATIREYRTQRVSGWILDLRGNPGGSVTMAACVAGLFIGPQVLVAYKIDNETSQRRDYLTPSDRVTSSPLAVLVDGSSASGSELLSGALQDYKRGWLVGEQTFGKGTTQSIRGFRVPGATGLVRNETTGLFFLPSGRTSQLAGITPDFVVPRRLGATAEQRFTPREKDLYVRPIAYDQNPWISARPQETQTIAACVEQNGKAKSRYSSSATQADYQMLYAIDVLDCR